MLYVFECMLYGLTCLYGGNDKPLQSTGEQLTKKDVGVCLLGWAIVVFLILFITYTIYYLIYKSKAASTKDIYSNRNNSNKIVIKKGFFNGIIYLLECIALGFLCLYGGTNRALYSTGKKPTSKEVVYCIMGWIYIIVVVVSLVLICA